MPWKLYDRLIDGIPEDVRVREYYLGLCWSYVEAESGMGVSFTCRHGAVKRTHPHDFHGALLRDMAQLAKSWNFEEATLGIAALNAWYGQKDLIEALGGELGEMSGSGDGSGRRQDAFDHMRPRIEAHENAHVVVVGHFPRVERISEFARLTVLERDCRSELDTPDPACEYVLPSADYAFITGVTLENKTAPRLLELARDAHVTMVGPSVVMGRALLDAGVNTMAGSIVEDPERVRHAVETGNGMAFGSALRMVTIDA